MYCRNCGKEIPQDSNYCPKCGTQQIASNENVVDETNEIVNNTDSGLSKRENKSKIGCSSILVIVGLMGLSLLLKPLVKQCTRQQFEQHLKHVEETTGVLGTGSDRASYIIDEIKKEMPFNLPMLGDIERVYYGTGLIIMEFEINDSYNPLELDINNVGKNSETSKDFVMTEIQFMSDNLRKAMEDIANESFSLSFDLQLKSDSRSANIVLGPSEIKEALNREKEEETETMTLLLTAKAEKMFLPIEVDQYTSWIDTYLDRYALTYVYEVDDTNFDFDSIDKEKLRKQMKDLLIHSSNQMRKTIELCLLSARNIGYKYIGTSTKKEFSIYMSPTELLQIEIPNK